MKTLKMTKDNFDLAIDAIINSYKYDPESYRNAVCNLFCCFIVSNHPDCLDGLNRIKKIDKAQNLGLFDYSCHELLDYEGLKDE